MKKNYNHIGILFLLFFLSGVEQGFSGEITTESWQLHQIRENKNGYLEKTDGDPYIVFPEINQPICSSKGIQLSIKFIPIPLNPVLMELFWSTESLGFGEGKKVFFTIHPQKTGEANRFIVPLDHAGVFSRVRLDFPGYSDATFKVEEYKIVSLDDPPEGIELIDTYYNLSIRESLTPDILIPYLFKAFKHGPQRLSHDKGFLLIWLLLIGFLLSMIRVSRRKIIKS